jgi:hypothetical protein
MQPLQIYLAGTCTFGIAKDQLQYRKLLDEEKVIADSVPHRLDSYHYVGTSRKVNEMRHAGVRIFLDSGAFSAYTLGQTISIDEYCQYILENDDIIRYEDGILMASVLDDIGDERITYENQKYMESKGVKPLPTFHTNEDTRYLDYYAANYEYMSLGGMVGASPAQLMIWLDRMWNNHLLDGAGNPKTRVHGFGITSVPLMERYPWYSCDSSSWIQTTSFGGITIPGYGNMDVSQESPNRHVAGQHLETLTPIEREKIEGIIRSQGFDPEQVRTRYLGRATYNMWAYQEIERTINLKKAGGHREPLVQELF